MTEYEEIDGELVLVHKCEDHLRSDFGYTRHPESDFTVQTTTIYKCTICGKLHNVEPRG